MVSSESSGQDLDVRALRKLIRDIRESIGVMAEFTDGIVEQLADIVHIRLNMLSVASDLVELRLRSEVGKQIEALPGKLSQIGL